MNTRPYLLLLAATFFFCMSSMQAENVSADRASQIAGKFCRQLQIPTLKNDTPQLTLVYEAKSKLRSSEATNYFYVFNLADSEGFIIISGDDRAHPVLGYSTEKKFDTTKMSPSLVYWLERYQEQIDYAVDNNTPVNNGWLDLEEEASTTELRASGPLIQATWGQEEPYNNLCPLIDGERSLSGCVATAMAMIMHYHKHPIVGSGSRNEVTFDTEYEWENMLNNYYSFEDQAVLGTAEEQQAVAELMYHCGQSVNSNYGTAATSANTSFIVAAMPEYFGYDWSAELKLKSAYSSSNWDRLLKNEFDMERPVLYSGQSNTGGHAFICDGYDDSDKFHINWGWDGYGNGYFALDALQAEEQSNYSNYERIIVNLKKRDADAVAYSPLMITNNYRNGTGITLDIPVNEITLGVPFNIDTKCLTNPRYNTYNGYVAAVITNSDGELKEFISNIYGADIRSSYYYPTFLMSCTIYNNIAEEEQIRLVSSVNGQDDWLLINGGIDVVDRITLEASPIISINSILLDVTSKEMTTGEAFTLEATVIPSNATNKSVSWESDKPHIATVSDQGIVQAVAEGEATITVTTEEGKHTANCEITVLPAKEPVHIEIIPSDIVNEEDWGSFTLSLSIPEETDFEGSLTVNLPEGMTLNEELTCLPAPLDKSMHIEISKEETNCWLINLKSNSLKADDYIYQNILLITYDVSDNVDNGDYRIILSDVCLEFVDGTYTHDNEVVVNVVIERIETGIDAVTEQAVDVFIRKDELHINSPSKERITIYNISGAVILTHDKEAGPAVIQLSPVADRSLILKGESGWVRKIIKQDP